MTSASSSSGKLAPPVDVAGPASAPSTVAVDSAHQDIRLSANSLSGIEPGTPARIVLADGNVERRASAARLLAEAGHGVECAGTVQEALAAVRAHRPDLVVADAKLRGRQEDGLLPALRSDPLTAALPVMLITTRAGFGRGHEPRADDYLARPFSADELLARVATLLELARLRRRTAEQQVIYDTALSNIPDFAYTFDLEGRFAYANRALLEMFGLPVEQVIGKNFHELHYTPESAEKLTRQVQQVIATRQSLRDEIPYTNAKGRGGLFEYVFTPAFDKAGELTAVVGITRDITARQAAEEMVRASRDQFQEIADTAPAMLWITESDGTCTFLSRSWYEYTGQAPGEGLGSGWTKATHPDDRAAVAQAFFTANQRREPFAFDYRVRRADGEYRWAVDAGRPRFAPGGEFLGFIGSVIDIHQRKEAEAALEERAAALREADRRKDEFLAMLAHELRNPLASVANAVTLLKEAGPPRELSPEATETSVWAAEIIDRQARQLARLVDDLLDVSRITRGKIELRRVALDAAGPIASAGETVAPLVAARGHSLIAEFPQGELWLEADPTRLEQIVVNLLTNAAKFSEPRGRILVRARRLGEEIVIQVSDSGIGIAPERVTEMFELFAQGERSAARSEGGLGIGLTVVRGLCELHGGSVSAYSGGLGKGSIFTVRLPAARRPGDETSTIAQAADAPREYSGVRVLVVDDSADSAATLGRLLARRGYKITLAHDGLEALEKAREILPAAILLDIGLPGIDGYEVARRLRREPAGAGVLLVAISGYGQAEDRIQSSEAGFDHHLIKPVDFSELLSLLSGVGDAPRAT